jgi:transglutaminase/protease-like cytokinesis protein 3
MTLTGTTPRVDASKNITVIKVEELNTKNVALKESAVIKERYVSNPAEVKGLVQAEKGKLDAFRTSIDSAASKGVNTDTAEVQYTAAKVALESAAKATSVQSSQQYATAAERAIADGEKSIGDSLTQKMITEAGEPIDLLDEQIVFFRVNRSMTADARVADIQARRDRAAGLISTANDLRKEGKFTDAQAKIGEARNVADQAYEAALALRKEVGESSNPTELITKPLESSVSFLKGALIWIGVGLILVVLVVVGVILMRRRSGWDELG